MNNLINGVFGIEGLLRNASTHALISVCRWSGVEALEGEEAKLDGVSTMIPETRPREGVQDVIVDSGLSKTNVPRPHPVVP
jgi:hypothetical protein